MMEEDIELWQQVFQELIQEVKPWHKWTLTQDKGLLPDVLKPGWMQYQQKTFARFHCSWCSRSWASGCVLTIFHMHWCEKKGQGQVKMRVFAQRCNKCPEPPFAAPEFTWDNISRILNNLLFRILKRCYGEGFKQVDEIPLLGDSSLEGPHDSSNCEACLQGFCAQSGLGLASKPPARPLSPTPSKSTREPKVTAIHSSNVPRSQTSLKVEKPQASKVDPKTSNPTKAALKVSHTSHPSTTILTVQQVSAVSSPTPACITQMPSPIKSSKAADAGKKTRSKTPKALPPSSSFVPPTPSSFVPPTYSPFAPPTSSSFAPPTPSSFAPPTSSSLAPPTPSSFAPPTPSYVVPNSWRPPANTARQVERSVHIPPPSESCCESCCGACCQCGTACCEGFCNCMAHKPCQSLVFLFFVAIIVTLYIKYGL